MPWHMATAAVRIHRSQKCPIMKKGSGQVTLTSVDSFEEIEIWRNHLVVNSQLRMGNTLFHLIGNII